MLIKFLTIVAYVLGSASTLVLLVKIFQALTYTELERIRDELCGLRRTFPAIKPFIVALLCWAFIVAKCSYY